MFKFYPDKTHENYFDKNQTTTLKGILILLVFIHHFTQYINYPKFYDLTFIMGPFAVNAFFLIAGYATILGFEKRGTKPDKSFLIKRALRVYIPLTLIGITENNFLVGLLWMYLASFIAYRFLSPQKRFPFILFMNLAFIVFFMAISPLNCWWFDRVIPYSFGAYFAMNKSKLMGKFENKGFLYSAFVISLFCTGFFAYRMPKWDLAYLPEALGLSLFESILILTFYYMFHYEDKPFAFFGKISFEIFFLHQAFFPLIGNVVDDKKILFIASFVATVVASYLLQLLWNAVQKKIPLS